MTFFSIIIPVYNLENYITRALDSLLKQNFAPSLFEVIAVDDGSSDNSLNILHEYAQQYKNLRVFHQENQGVSVARNLALKHVEGQYVSFLDGDDEFFKDSLKEIYAVLQKHDVDVIYNYAFVNDGTKNLRQVHKTPSRVINYEICSIKQLGDFLNGGSVWGGDSIKWSSLRRTRFFSLKTSGMQRTPSSIISCFLRNLALCFQISTYIWCM